ncbi:GCG_CRPN prefix-to-repeats domain-containing protein [Caulobacter sp. S45]|uniref:GCG_CRPN prefix-to-repeats domain-containing protein n=1 Tax=Caulobacter sp. S45 TaxID=1641861 RepID=UPI001577364E|nr:hypothetical protein [Caulobacter sp. S45]
MRKALLLGMAAATLAVAPLAHAAGGCGPYGHRGWGGVCRPNGPYGPRPLYGPVYGPGPAIGVFYPGRGYWYGGRYYWHRGWGGRGWRYY